MGDHFYCYYFCLPCIFFQSPVLPGLQLASCRCNLAAPCPVPLSFHSWISVSLLRFFRLSRRIEWSVAYTGGQLEHVKHLCMGASHSCASLSLSLALAPWIRVLNRGCALTSLSHTLLSVRRTPRQFLPYVFFFLIKVNGEWKMEWRATRKLVINR